MPLRVRTQKKGLNCETTKTKRKKIDFVGIDKCLCSVTVPSTVNEEETRFLWNSSKTKILSVAKSVYKNVSRRHVSILVSIIITIMSGIMPSGMLFLRWSSRTSLSFQTVCYNLSPYSTLHSSHTIFPVI